MLSLQNIITRVNEVKKSVKKIDVKAKIKVRQLSRDLAYKEQKFFEGCQRVEK